MEVKPEIVLPVTIGDDFADSFTAISSALAVLYLSLTSLRLPIRSEVSLEGLESFQIVESSSVGRLAVEESQ